MNPPADRTEAASASGASGARFTEELLRINNEQANSLRAASKELAVRDASGSPTREEDAFYNELTRVNNELANVQRELVRKNAELSRLSEEKNRFLGMAAHDLRNPLGVILSYSEFLGEDGSLSPEQREFVAVIRQTSEFMLSLVNEMLDVSAIEAGKLELERIPLDLGGLLRRNVALNQTLAASKGITIRMVLPPGGGPQVLADAGKLHQVLNNLIGNAIKFSPRNQEVEVSLQQDGVEAVVEVRDRGPGIDPAELPRLFKPFGRASTRATAGELSTGLGLAIVRRMVEGHGGSVGVESHPGQGALLRFRLPLDPGNRSQGALENAGEGGGQPGPPEPANLPKTDAS